MPANVIFADTDAGATALFGKASSAAVDYMKQSVDNFCNALGTGATYLGERAQQHFNNVTFGGFARQVEAIRNKVNMFWEEDVIRPMINIGEIQQAKPQMARWIMANHNLRQLYLSNRIDGYDENTYIDNDPNSGVGAGNYDYDVITSGIVQHRVVDGVRKQFIRHSVNNKYEEEIALTLNDRLNVAHTWDMIERSLDNDTVDPTSSWNGTIR